jgi:hypothetical protein
LLVFIFPRGASSQLSALYVAFALSLYQANTDASVQLHTHIPIFPSSRTCAGSGSALSIPIGSKLPSSHLKRYHAVIPSHPLRFRCTHSWTDPTTPKVICGDWWMTCSHGSAMSYTCDACISSYKLKMCAVRSSISAGDKCRGYFRLATYFMDPGFRGRTPLKMSQEIRTSRGWRHLFGGAEQ